MSKYPFQRSNFDVDMQKRYGTKCVEKYTENFIENYPTCNGSTKVLALEDPSNPWSFFAYYDTPNQKKSVKESFEPTYSPTYAPTYSPTYSPTYAPTYTPSYTNPTYEPVKPNKPAKKGIFLFCFANWCGYSKMYISTWENFKKQLEHSYNFGVLDMSNGLPMIDSSLPPEINNFISSGNVKGFPTILFVYRDNNDNIKIDIINDRDNIHKEVLKKFGDFTYI
jgi:thiol-disulfide isomerase/thioredoxin